MSYTAAVITISDKGSRGERLDTSGPALCTLLEAAGYQIIYTQIIPDEAEQIAATLRHCADHLQAALILTTGGTGFSPRDITPEATGQVVERLTPGISEAMRAESLRITPRGCLSRGIAGIRGRSLIINLPGSEKAAKENLQAVLSALSHGLDMLYSAGSADCASPEATTPQALTQPPDLNLWLQEAKADVAAGKIGMYLLHNGVVRASAKAQVRQGENNLPPVKAMHFSYDAENVAAACAAAQHLEGIYYIRTWLNQGRLQVGDDIMYVLIGGDIRPHIMHALDFLVGKIKSECVTETEIF